MALVVSFTHLGPGTPAQAWRAEPGFGTGDPLDLAEVERIVVLAAHPDDEALGAAGLVATATRAGIRVDLVVATDGEGSHPDSPTLPPSELAEVRHAEALEAARAMAVPQERLHRLRLPDGGVEAHVEQVTRVVVELVGDGADCVVVAPWRQDGHPDHEAMGRAGAAAARRTGAELWEFPIWFWHFGRPQEAPWGLLRPFRLDQTAEAVKARAIAAHRSQVEPLSELSGDEVLLGPDLLAHFLPGPEHYLRTPGQDCPDPALDELHRREEDPWGVESRWYERRKRDLVLAVLPRMRFEHALELGCSTGALAASLADRADRVLAVDSSPAALAAARRRFADDPRVTVAGLDVPGEWPEGSFDLVVVSEIGYFLSPRAIERLVDRVAGSLSPDGVVVLCHWRHHVEGWPLDADTVHAAFERGPGPGVAASYRDRDMEIRVHAGESGWPDPLR